MHVYYSESPLDKQDGKFKVSPLHYAAQNGHHTAAETMLNKGATMSLKDKNGDTPVHVAAMSGYVEYVYIYMSKSYI